MSSLSSARSDRRGLLARLGLPATSLGALVCLWLVYAMNANTRQIFYYVIPPHRDRVQG